MVRRDMYWRNVGTHRGERFRPGFRKPKTYYRSGLFGTGKKYQTGRLVGSAKKKGWQKAVRFGSWVNPASLIGASLKGPVTDWAESRGGGSKSSPSRTGSPWAPRSRASSQRKSGQYIRRRRMTKGDSGIRRGARTPTRPKAVPYRKGGCPPGYRYDRRRKMCVRK